MKRKRFLVKERCPSCWHSSSARRHFFALCAARRLLCSSSSARGQFSAQAVLVNLARVGEFSALCADGFSPTPLLDSLQPHFTSIKEVSSLSNDESGGSIQDRYFGQNTFPLHHRDPVFNLYSRNGEPSKPQILFHISIFVYIF